MTHATSRLLFLFLYYLTLPTGATLAVPLASANATALQPREQKFQQDAFVNVYLYPRTDCQGAGQKFHPRYSNNYPYGRDDGVPMDFQSLFFDRGMGLNEVIDISRFAFATMGHVNAKIVDAGDPRCAYFVKALGVPTVRADGPSCINLKETANCFRLWER